MSDSDAMPTDVDELTGLVTQLRGKVKRQSLFIDQLLEQIRLAGHQRFGSHSEHYSPDQLQMLIEAMDIEGSSVDDVTDNIDDIPSDRPSATPKKRERRKLPDHLPRVEIEHTLDEHACQCEHCHAVMEPLSHKTTGSSISFLPRYA